MQRNVGVRRSIATVATLLSLSAALLPRLADAQQGDPIRRLDLSIGRSFPITSASPITRVSIANPDVADVVVIGERELVINARGNGETDAIIWKQVGEREHYRVVVHSPADRQQVVLAVKFAEVRRDVLHNLSVSGRAVDASGNRLLRGGQGTFRSDAPINSATGRITIPNPLFFTLLTDFGTDEFLALLEAEEQRGFARTLAEPNLMAGNRDSATFLAGGELPIPVVQGGAQVGGVTIVFREFGIRLRFSPEILNDSLIKLHVRPEVSTLDFANAVTLQGFRIPAIRTRRVETTLDVRRNESIVISGLFNSERERVRTGIPLLMDIPILGNLFSSTRWQKNDSELLVVVTPVIVDPLRPRPVDTMRFPADTTRPAAEAFDLRGRRSSSPPTDSQTPPRSPE